MGRGWGRPSFEMHCLLWCWGRTSQPERRFCPITPAKGKKRIRRRARARPHATCPQTETLLSFLHNAFCPPYIPEGSRRSPPLPSFFRQETLKIPFAKRVGGFIGAPPSGGCLRERGPEGGFSPGWRLPRVRALIGVRGGVLPGGADRSRSGSGSRASAVRGIGPARCSSGDDLFQQRLGCCRAFRHGGAATATFLRTLLLGLYLGEALQKL
jgi:hypothetical protein